MADNDVINDEEQQDTGQDGEDTAAQPGEGAAAPAGEDDAAASDLETLAADFGWAPKDKWRGNPDDWVDAATFIRNGYEMNRATMRQLDHRLDTMSATLEGMQRAQNDAIERTRKATIDDLKRQQREAVAEGDEELHDAVTERLEALRAGEDSKKAPDAAQQSDPHYDAFVARNPWWQEDVDKSKYAMEVAQIVGPRYPNGGAQFYAKIEAEVEKKFATKANPNRTRPASVEGAGPAGGGGRRGAAQGYADLPADAKAACDKFIAQGVYVGSDGKPLPVDEARKQYCQVYFAEDAA